jgi:hypothetical protein
MKLTVMYKSAFTFVAVMIAAGTSPAFADTAAPNMNDFAYGAKITPADSALISFPLTPIIIKEIKRHDLGDIRVYDGNNKLMPSKAREKDGPITTSQQRLTVTSLWSAGKKTGYLVDRTSNHKPALKSLLLKWKRGKEPKILSLRVEHSADKKSWETLAENVTVVNFDFEGFRLNQNIVDINDYTGRYIKLSFPARNQPPVLASVTAYTTNKRISDYWWIHAGKLQASDNSTNEYHFSIEQGIRPAAIKFLFPKINSILSGSLFTIDTHNGKQQRKLVEKNFTAYTVTLNSSVANSRAIDISHQPAADWLIKAGESKNMEPDNLPGVLAGYPQYEVVFANDGEAPYTAVWGNADVAAPPAGDITERFKAVSETSRSLSEARTGVVIDNQALTEIMESRQFSWLAVLVWLAVAVITTYALRIVYQRYLSTKKRST